MVTRTAKARRSQSQKFLIKEHAELYVLSVSAVNSLFLEEAMLTEKQNEQLTRVGPGTPMGELFRRYWHPVAAVSQMKERKIFQVKILGEDLVLYKDRSGGYGLIEPRCPHRKMSMMYGIPDEDGIRCAYHGWRFDKQGRCTDQPYDRTEDPEGRFKQKIKIRSYPIQDLGGLLLAYLGPLPEPLLPHWDLYVMEDVVRDVGYAVIPCNWLQIMENSLDSVHVEWLHQNFYNYVVAQMGNGPLQRARQKHAKIGFDRFEYGIVKRRIVEGDFFFSSRRRHTRLQGDWSSDVCSSDLSLLLRHRQPSPLQCRPASRRQQVGDERPGPPPRRRDPRVGVSVHAGRQLGLRRGDRKSVV